MQIKEKEKWPMTKIFGCEFTAIFNERIKVKLRKSNTALSTHWNF